MRTLFIAVVALFVSGFVYGQASPQITVSAEKVNVNGVVMYVHKVKAKETLYSISKAYNVAIDEIVRNNDSLKAGLKEGSTIYIPSREAAAVTADDAPAQEAHTTELAASSWETEWKLSGENIKKYSRKKHTVKWYEQLADVAAKYNVPAEAIVSFNNLKDTQLKKKQVLYIPNNEFLVLLEKKAAEAADAETPVAANETQEIIETVTEEIVVKGSDTVRIAYILPLNLADTLGANSNFMDFYSGALLAANRMKEEGMEITIDLFDNSADNIEPGTNYVVGPVRASDMAKFLNVHSNKGYHIISPMDMSSEQFIEGNGMFIQAPASQKAQIHNLVKLFAGKCTPQNNAVVIYEKGESDSALVKETLDLLDTLGVNYTQISYGILEGREILEKLMPLFQPQMENLVLVPSNSEAFVNDVVRNMNLLHTNPLEENRRAVTLFGTPRWRNFETIEVDYFHRMNLHLSLPYFVDYSNADVKDFLMKYRALYNGEPTPFAFQGYDITGYFLTLHKNYGNRFSRVAGLEETRMLQSKFNFVQNDSSQPNGFENTGTVNIMYNNDYTISVLE